MVVANHALPKLPSLACFCSLFPANRDSSCIVTPQSSQDDPAVDFMILMWYNTSLNTETAITPQLTCMARH